MEQKKDLLSPKEAAAQLGVSTDFIRVHIRKGHIRSLRIGRLLKVHAADIEQVKQEGLKQDAA